MEKEERKILAFGMFGAWLTCMFFLTTVSVFTTLLTVIILLVRKSSTAKYAVFLNPFVFLALVNIGQGAADYFRGDARIRSFGEPSVQFANIDIESRLERKAMGCSVTGTSALSATVYNQTVRKLVSVLGFQEGSYEGVFPSGIEARKILQDDISSYGLCRLKDDNYLELSDPWNDYMISLEKQHGLVRATILGSKLISRPKVVRLNDDCILGQLNEHWIYLIDIRENRILAQYGAEDRYQ
ncbi:MAG: hypothetical protein ACRBG0_20785 [Lewinella sp.]|uniref:hypothetical protein n=1 Tax=Lewinella sp. TaxID=2004506 RepID=UPI003D6C6082